MIKVSIIIPVYNAQDYLAQCIESVLAQTMDCIEILCIDDGSTDSSLKILRKYEEADSRIKVYSKPNSGYGCTINYGLARSTGKYVAIVESDDFIDADGIEKLFVMAEATNADYVRTNYYEFREGKDQLNGSLNAYSGNKGFSAIQEPEVFYTIEVSPWACLYKKDLIDKYQIRMNETPGASFQDNSWQFIVLLMAGRIVFSSEAFYHYRTDNMNSSVNSREKVFCVVDEKRYMEEKMDEYHLENPDILAAFGKFIYVIYKWNYGRIAGEFQYDFLLEWKEEILRQYEAGILKKEIFSRKQWEEINCIAYKTDWYFEKTSKKSGEIYE